MPAEHFGLFILAMPDRIHAELAQHEWPIFGQILQAQQVTLELALVVQVNVEAKEIDILREEKFGRRITARRRRGRSDLPPGRHGSGAR